MSRNPNERKWGEAAPKTDKKPNINSEDNNDDGTIHMDSFSEDKFEDPFAETNSSNVDNEIDAFNPQGFEDLVDEEGEDDQKKKKGLDDPNLKKVKKDMQYMTCGILGVGNLCEGFMIGTIFGGVQGIVGGASSGVIRQPGFGRLLFQSAISSGNSLGVLLGVYSASRCSLALTRKVDDKFNTFAAGFLGGCVSSLKSRNPRFILLNGAAAATVITILDSFTNMKF